MAYVTIKNKETIETDSLKVQKMYKGISQDERHHIHHEFSLLYTS